MSGSGRRGGGYGGSRPFKPAREWIGIAGNGFNATAATAANSLYSFEAPTVTIGTALNFDAPEDLTLLRIRASLTVTMAGTGTWGLVLLVQDQQWTPNTMTTDSDKRFLWSQIYSNNSAAATSWQPHMMSVNLATPTFVYCPEEAWQIDIAPKVRLEAGKGLYMVAYELAGATTLTVEIHNARILQQRARRAGR